MCGAELSALPEGVQRVARLLQEQGHAHSPVMLEDAARTAQQAADALGVSLGQIAKSIVFKRKPDDVAVLIITSGDQRVDDQKVQALVCAPGQRLGRADADFVKACTGFSIGGVSPVGHLQPPVLLVDASLFRFTDVWAAAGHPHAVFQATPADLQRLTGAPVVDVAVSTLPLATPLQMLAERAQQVSRSPTTEPVPSPCISVCRVNTERAQCEGCLRTLDEIARWGRASNADKRAVWQLLGQRAAALS